MISYISHYITLRPGDKYNLATRKVMHRAISDSPLTIAFVDSVFSKFAGAGAPSATVLVAQDGNVLVNSSSPFPTLTICCAVFIDSQN